MYDGSPSNPSEVIRLGELDPQARAFLDRLAAQGAPPLERMSVAEARRANREAKRWQQRAGEPVAGAQDVRIDGPHGKIPLRIYRPEQGPLPLLLYLHGGGWVQGDLDTHDPVCRLFANRARCLVVSVDYRRAPEHRFPAAVEEAYAATKWASENAERLGGDAARLAVAGDSAGGTLAATTALLARERGGPALIHQLLIYPVTDLANFETDSYREFATGYGLTRAAMRWFRDHYLEHASDAANGYASPLRAANLSGLPSARVLTAEFDPLRDEGEAYAARLREAGVPVELERFAGMVHGFVNHTAVVDRAHALLVETAERLRAALAR